MLYCHSLVYPHLILIRHSFHSGIVDIVGIVEEWTLKKSDRNRIEAFEMWCWRKMLSISWPEHHTNDSILTELGLERELMGRVAKQHYYTIPTRTLHTQTASKMMVAVHRSHLNTLPSPPFLPIMLGMCSAPTLTWPQHSLRGNLCHSGPDGMVW